MIRRRIGRSRIEEALIHPSEKGELVVVVSASSPALATPLMFRRVYRREAGPLELDPGLPRNPQPASP